MTFGVKLRLPNSNPKFGSSPYLPAKCCIIATKQEAIQAPKNTYVFKAPHFWIPVYEQPETVD